MLNQQDILSTIHMIDQQNLDIRTITMGISLLDCCHSDPKVACAPTPRWPVRRSTTRSPPPPRTW